MPTLHDQLAALRTDLVDLAFILDTRGACVAADVAMTTAARLTELCAAFPSPTPAAPESLPAESLRLRRRPPSAVSRP